MSGCQLRHGLSGQQRVGAQGGQQINRWETWENHRKTVGITQILMVDDHDFSDDLGVLIPKVGWLSHLVITEFPRLNLPSQRPERMEPLSASLCAITPIAWSPAPMLSQVQQLIITTQNASELILRWNIRISSMNSIQPGRLLATPILKILYTTWKGWTSSWFDRYLWVSELAIISQREISYQISRWKKDSLG
jgi:hypothetical protein